MNKSINDCIKLLKDGETTINHQDKDTNVEVKHTQSATYLKKEKVLIKGERNNLKQMSRKALISAFDVFSNMPKGIDKFHLLPKCW